MKRCPTCNETYPDSALHCNRDGTMLVGGGYGTVVDTTPSQNRGGQPVGAPVGTVPAVPPVIEGNSYPGYAKPESQDSYVPGGFPPAGYLPSPPAPKAKLQASPFIVAAIALAGLAVVLVGMLAMRAGMRPAPPPITQVDPPSNNLRGTPSLDSGVTTHVVVPSVLGQTESEAKQVLQLAGLKARTSIAATEGGEPGTVQAQTPASESEALKDSTVLLILAPKPRPGTPIPANPDLSGKDAEIRETPPPRETPVPDPADVSTIQAKLADWESAWESYDFERFFSHYAPDARIKTLRSNFTYRSFQDDQRRKFANPGRLNIGISNVQIRAEGDSAEVSFRDEFSRVGGLGGTYRSVSRETWRLRRENGRWLIVEDVCRPN